MSYKRLKFLNGILAYFTEDSLRLESATQQAIEIQGRFGDIIPNQQNFIVIYNDKAIANLETNWDEQSGNIQELYRHGKKLTHLCYISNTVLFSDGSGEVFKFQISGTNIGEVQFAYAHQCTLTTLQINQQSVISSDKELKIKIVDFPNTYNVKHILMEHKVRIVKVALHNGLIYSLDEGGSLIQWVEEAPNRILNCEGRDLISVKGKLILARQAQLVELNEVLEEVNVWDVEGKLEEEGLLVEREGRVSLEQYPF